MSRSRQKRRRRGGQTGATLRRTDHPGASRHPSSARRGMPAPICGTLPNLARIKMTAPIMTGKFHKTDDLRIKEIKELLSPDQIRREFPLTEKAAQTTYETRRAIHRILHGADDRLLVIVGPCSIHDTRSEEHTSELQSHHDLVCRLLLEK